SSPGSTRHCAGSTATGASRTSPRRSRCWARSWPPSRRKRPADGPAPATGRAGDAEPVNPNADRRGPALRPDGWHLHRLRGIRPVRRQGGRRGNRSRRGVLARLALVADPRAQGRSDVNFGMKTPCGNCPFLRKSGAVRLMRSRIEQIAGVMLDPHGGTFTCHKTTVEVEDEDGNCDREDGPNATHCAGALIFAEKNGNQTQMMRIAGRI